MTDLLRRILALTVCLTVVGGGTFCRCAAASAPAAETPLLGSSHACCDHSPSATGTPPVRHDRAGGEGAGTPRHPTPQCERCNAQVAPSPDVRSTAPSPAASPVFYAGVLSVATFSLSPPAQSKLRLAATDSPPRRDRLTLYALRCSLLD
jgi:hypothetical protein